MNDNIKGPHADHPSRKYTLARPKGIISSPSNSKLLSKYKTIIPYSFLSPQHSASKGTIPTIPCQNSEAKGSRILSPKPSSSLCDKLLPKSLEKLPDLTSKRNEYKPHLTLSMHTINVPPSSNTPKVKIEPSKISTKKVGVIKAYAANTHQGIVRNYNEDRVSIILNIIKPSNKNVTTWPKCALFGVYDGHGGSHCADFLRDHLHHFITKDYAFPNDPLAAITQGLSKAESSFLEHCEIKGERSGSCAVVALFVDDTCYIANVGDSRAVLSENGGKIVAALSEDHKPNSSVEFDRILSNGGNVYQPQISAFVKSMPGNENLEAPYRVLPGRLSVSRTFGDIEAKFAKYNGKPNVIIAVPDIKTVKVTEKTDFILLGCDGIFDKLTNEDVVRMVWTKARTEHQKGKTIHEIAGECVVHVLEQAMETRSLDNVTAVLIVFKSFKRTLKEGLKIEIPHKMNGGIPLIFKENIVRSLSPTQQLTFTKSLMEPFGVGKRASAINFAGIKGLMEMSKRGKGGA